MCIWLVCDLKALMAVGIDITHTIVCVVYSICIVCIVFVKNMPQNRVFCELGVC